MRNNAMLHKHEPIAEKVMGHVSPNNSVCQVLRDIYHRTDDPYIKLNCRVAVTMAKKMSDKLTEHKKEWQEGFWDNRRLVFKCNSTDKAKVQVTIG
jgi:ABC-type Zn uptake system ZnuABC Zn-binding protein ZnuA